MSYLQKFNMQKQEMINTRVSNVLLLGIRNKFYRLESKVERLDENGRSTTSGSESGRSSANQFDENVSTIWIASVDSLDKHALFHKQTVHPNFGMVDHRRN